MKTIVNRSSEKELNQAIADLEERGFRLIKKSKEINSYRTFRRNYVTRRKSQDTSQNMKFMAIMEKSD